MYIFNIIVFLEYKLGDKGERGDVGQRGNEGIQGPKGN